MHVRVPVPTSSGLLKNKVHVCVTTAFPARPPEPAVEPGPQFSHLGHGGDNLTMLLSGQAELMFKLPSLAQCLARGQR